MDQPLLSLPVAGEGRATHGDPLDPVVSAAGCRVADAVATLQCMDQPGPQGVMGAAQGHPGELNHGRGLRRVADLVGV